MKVQLSSVSPQVRSCEDHLGLQKFSEVLAQTGGSVFPLDPLQDLVLKSSIRYLLSPEGAHRLACPGTLQWTQGGLPGGGLCGPWRPTLGLQLDWGGGLVVLVL